MLYRVIRNNVRDYINILIGIAHIIFNHVSYRMCLRQWSIFHISVM